MATQSQYNNIKQQIDNIQSGINAYTKKNNINLTRNNNGSYTASPNNVNPTAIPADQLNSNVTPYKLPTPQTPNYGGMESIISSAVSNAQTTKQNDVTSAENAKNKSLEDLMSAVIDQSNISSSVDRTAQDEAKKKYDQFTSQLEAEQLANRRAIENLQKNNPQGLFGGALNDEINRINRDSLSKQADIAILQSAANRDYSTAAEIADRQVALKTEQGLARLEALKLFYNDNKETFNKLEERQYAEAIKKADREYQKELDTENEIKNIKLQALTNEAPASVISAISRATTFDEALSAAGRYGVDYISNRIKRASLEKSSLEISKLQKEINALDEPLDTYGLPNTTAGFATKLMASGKNDKQLDATERQSLSKARTVIGQLDALQSNIQKQRGTSVMKGKTRNLLEKFGLNADVGVINAQLQAITPNLARGTYGEVGVLTDNDIANYRKTLPRLDRPQDQNDAVLALTLKTVLNSMENTLSSAANSGINVSGWTQDYINIKNQINTIEDRIGVSKNAVDDLVAGNPNLAPAIKELYQNGFTDGEILEALNAR